MVRTEAERGEGNEVEAAAQGNQDAELACFFKAADVHPFKRQIRLRQPQTAAHDDQRDGHFDQKRCPTFAGAVDAVFAQKEKQQTCIQTRAQTDSEGQADVFERRNEGEVHQLRAN